MEGEPEARWGHCAVRIEQKIFVWSGCTSRSPDVHTSSSVKESLASEVYIFQINNSKWYIESARGIPPCATRGSAFTTNGDKNIFNFGGYCGHGLCFYNDLHQLDSDTIIWSTKNPKSSDSLAPMKKQDCGMVYYQNPTTRVAGLCVVGGAGIDSSSKKGWKYTNEVHFFDLNEGTWSKCEVKGNGPPPCSGFSLHAFKENKAILFGGRSEKEISNDIYFLNLEEWSWDKIAKPLGSPWPNGRESHAFGYCDQFLTVVGGLNNDDVILEDAWILNTDSMEWKEMVLPSENGSRVNATAILLQTKNKGLQLILYGGSKFVRGTDHNQQPMLSHTFIAIFDTVIDGHKLCTDMPSVWYDLSPMGLQVMRLNDTVNQLKAQMNSDEMEPHGGSERYRDLLMKSPELKDVLYLLRKLSSHWHDIGGKLQVSIDERNSLLHETKISDDGKLEQIIHLWISSQTTDVTWKKLLEMLIAFEKKNIASKVTDFLDTQEAYDKYAGRSDYQPFRLQ